MSALFAVVLFCPPLPPPLNLHNTILPFRLFYFYMCKQPSRWSLPMKADRRWEWSQIRRQKNYYGTSTNIFTLRALASDCQRICCNSPVAKFIVPDWGDKVDSGKGLSYRPAKLHRLAGRYDNLCRSQPRG
jgi:hypothetical protein